VGGVAVTYVIPAGSPKAARAAEFGAELTRAMKSRGVGTRTVAEKAGAGRSAVMYWRTGRMLPRYESALRLADALSWPRLRTLAADARRKACVVCAVAFIDDSGSDNRRYCSESCHTVADKARVGRPTRLFAVKAERRAATLAAAIAAMCRSCEPEGVCRQPECPLRAVSPFRCVPA
jgi:transcriptional regulator with XRE-family HTH domain